MKHNFYLINGLALVFLLTVSCSVSKTASFNSMDFPEHYRNSEPKDQDTLNTMSPAFFNDVFLNAYIEKALLYNHDIQLALKTTDQLLLYYKQAKRQLQPTLDFNAGGNRGWVSKNSLNGSLAEQFTGNKYIDDYSATLVLSWEIDFWGKSNLQKKLGLYSYLAQRDEVQALKTRITAQVAQTYYSLIALDNQLSIAKRNLKMRQEIFKNLQLQFNAGHIDALAVNQAGIQEKNAALLIPVAQQQIAIQEQALSLLMGEYPETIKRSKEYQLISTFSEGVPADLLRNRPDVRAAEHQIMRFDAQTQLTHIARYPNLNISPSIGLNAVAFEKWFSLPGSLLKTIAVNLSMPILQKKQLKTNYKLALIDQEKAGIEFQKTIMTAVTEVTDALSKTKQNSERLALIKDREQYIKNTLNSANLLLIYTLLALRSIGSAFHMPAMQASIPLLAPKSELLRIAGINQIINSVSNIAGPALGALAIGFMSIGNVLLLDIAGAIIAITSLLFISIPNIKGKTNSKANVILVFKDLKTAYLEIRKSKGLTLLFVYCSLAGICIMPIVILLPLLTIQHFNGGKWEMGIIETLWGMGALIAGGLLSLKGLRYRKIQLVSCAHLIIGGAFFGAGLLPSTYFILYAILISLGGISATFYNAGFTATVQEMVQPDMLGRVFSMYYSLDIIPTILAIIGAGFLAEEVGLNVVFIILGISVFGIGILSFLTPSFKQLN